jgi:hypothetical protein
LSAMYNAKEGGNVGGGGFLANDVLGALTASSGLGDPNDPSNWGYTVQFRNGVFTGGWSIDKFAADEVATLPTNPGGSASPAQSGSPRAIFNLRGPAPLPTAMSPSPKSYTCTTLHTDLNLLLTVLASNPALSFEISALQKQISKSCG